MREIKESLKELILKKLEWYKRKRGLQMQDSKQEEITNC